MRLRKLLSISADTTLIVSAATLFHLLLVGQIRWTTPIFRLTVSNVFDPLEVGLGILILKTVFGLNAGLFLLLANKQTLLSGSALRMHRYETLLRSLYVRKRREIFTSAITVLLLLCLLEGYFRYYPHTLPYKLGNHLASGYHSNAFGILGSRNSSGIRFMRPNYERQLYHNGYYWNHKTDSMGFRNPQERDRADVVLLGDSMIYGHGVEETSTVRHHLETLINRPVVNLGISGTSIHVQYEVLKQYGPSLEPGSGVALYECNLRRLSEPLCVLSSINTLSTTSVDSGSSKRRVEACLKQFAHYPHTAHWRGVRRSSVSLGSRILEKSLGSTTSAIEGHLDSTSCSLSRLLVRSFSTEMSLMTVNHNNGAL